jgi:hypothetical protein
MLERFARFGLALMLLNAACTGSNDAVQAVEGDPDLGAGPTGGASGTADAAAGGDDRPQGGSGGGSPRPEVDAIAPEADGSVPATRDAGDRPPDAARTADQGRPDSDAADAPPEADAGAPTPGDADDDGVPDAQDNCPQAANNRQEDTDDDGVGDACDVCPAVTDADQADADGDGVGDACEAEPGECEAGAIRACGVDVGACVRGVERCVDGAWGPCEGVEPVAERCNQIDDDCDGQVDEGLAGCEVCAPNCAGRRCGEADGCGGVCNPCAPDEVCANGVCLDGGLGRCEDCQASAQCTGDGAGLCVNTAPGTPAFCVFPCPVGRACDGGDLCNAVDGRGAYCVPPSASCDGPAVCASMADCGGGQYCGRTDRACHVGGQGNVALDGRCAADADCRPGLLCSDVLSLCTQQCDDDIDCAENLIDRTCRIANDGNRAYCTVF